MNHNNGPDGCAIFYKDAKFDLVDWDEYVLDVCGYKGNQVKEWHRIIQKL